MVIMKDSEHRKPSQGQEPIGSPLQITKKTSQEELLAYFSILGIKCKEEMIDITCHQLSGTPYLIYNSSNSHFHEEISLKILRHTQSYEFVDVEVRIGHYLFPKISILNFDVKSPLHKNSEEKFGKIHQCECQGKKLAVKCFQNPLNQFASDQTFKMVLYEYCMLLLASCLKAGPKMENLFGYNIMIFSTCIEIAMELCEEHYQSEITSTSKVESDLKQNLINLHAHNIINFDIKPGNIAFSPSFNRYVFLDFGLSKIVRQSIGFRSYTMFRGNHDNCSPEMKDLYQSREFSFIDLYYNDAYSLQKTFEKKVIKNRITSKGDSQVLQKILKDVGNFHKLYMIEYSLFQLNIQEELASKILKENEYTIEKLFDFMNTLKKSQKLKAFTFHIQLKYNNIKNVGQKTHSLSVEFQKSSISKIDQERENKLVKILNNFNINQWFKYLLDQLNQKNSTEIKKIYQLLNNQEQIKTFKRNDYLLILSKAIELNSAKFSFEDINILSKVAIRFLKLEQRTIKTRLKPIKELAQISMFLLEQSLRKQLAENYFFVFLYALNNAVIFKLYSFQQFFTIYESIVNIPLKFWKKIRLLLNFNSMMVWLNVECNEQAQKFQFNKKLHAKNSQIIKDCLNQNTPQNRMKVIRFVLDKLSTTVDDQILFLLGNQHQLLIDIKLWMAFKRINSANSIHNTIIKQISELLQQKQYYSSYDFTYIHFQFFNHYFTYLEETNNLQNVIQKYIKIPTLQRTKLINILKIFQKIDKKCHKIQCLVQFALNLRSEIQSDLNGSIFRCVLQGLKRILQRINIKDAYQNQNVVYLISNLAQFVIKKVYGIYKKYEPFSVIVYLSNNLCLDRSISLKFPKISKLLTKKADKTQQYTKYYCRLQKIYIKKSDKYSINVKMSINICLFQMLMMTNKKKQAFSFCQRLFLLVKFSKITNIAIRFLYSSLHIIETYSVYQKSFKDYYYLFVQGIKKQRLEQFHIKNLNQTSLIILIMLQDDLERSVQFVRRIVWYLTKHKSNQNMENLVWLAQDVSKKCLSSKRLNQKYRNLCQRLEISQNMNFIIFHYYATYYENDPIMDPKKFLMLFYQCVALLHFKVKQEMIKSVVLYYLQQNKMIYKKRKVRSLCLTLIRSQIIFMSISQIKKLCSNLFQWHKSHKDNIKILRLSQKSGNYQLQIEQTEESKRHHENIKKYILSPLMKTVQMKMRQGNYYFCDENDFY